MQNKTVIVTGASRGIGKATAIAFAKNGYNVVVNYNKSVKEASELLETLKDYRVILVKADVSKITEVKDMVNEAKKNFGKIDILVNNAGIVLEEKLFHEMSEQELDNLYNVNIKSVYNCCKEVIPDMVRFNEGNIINISSIYGIKGASCEVGYSATKAAVIAITQGLAQELASSNIRVNAVAPGCIDTDMNSYLTEEEKIDVKKDILLGRFGTPEDIAETILFLASDKSKYITGQVISPNGGILM